MMSPKIFQQGHPNNALLEMDKAFDSLNMALQEFGIDDPRKITLIERQNRVEMLRKRAAKKPK